MTVPDVAQAAPVPVASVADVPPALTALASVDRIETLATDSPAAWLRWSTVPVPDRITVKVLPERE